MGHEITALILGDVIGQSGCRAVFAHLKRLSRQHGADFVIVNAENASDGFGMTPALAERLFEAGAAVITTGNHIWQQREVFPLLDSEPRLLRPANYPPGAPGHGWAIVDVRGSKVAVANLQGRSRMQTIDCPFRKADDLLRSLHRETNVILVDFHAEATLEKEAFGVYLDGRVSAVVGTHTHVQTADARVLPKGTAYVTDLGSCGPGGSVIGFDPQISVRRGLTQLPLKNEVSENVAVLHGAVVRIDVSTGHAASIVTFSEQSAV